MDNRLLTIGTAAAWPDRNEPSSGFVLTASAAHMTADHVLLLECGTGVAGRLHELGVERIDDIVVTHAHADHAYDLVPLRYDYKFGNRMDQTHPRLHVNADTRQRLERQISAVTDDPGPWWDQGFGMQVLEKGQIGPWKMSTLAVEHFIPAVAVRLEYDDTIFVFSSDCGEGSLSALSEFAHGCTTLVCEAALPATCPSDHPARTGHLDPKQAAWLARDCQAKQLLLTHVPANYDIATALAQAQEIFPAAQHTRSGAVHLI